MKRSVSRALRIARAHGGQTEPHEPRPPSEPKEPRPPAHEGFSHVSTHVGPIHSGVAGRTDHLPMHVESGAYVIPADIVSSMGEGNTMNGFKQIKRIFGGLPGNQQAEPYAQPADAYGQGASPYGEGSSAPYGGDLPGKAGGGPAGGGRPPVGIVAAGGEYVLHPTEVQAAGDGDIDMGHRVLDEFVKRMRAKAVKTLRSLPGPKRD